MAADHLVDPEHIVVDLLRLAPGSFTGLLLVKGRGRFVLVSVAVTVRLIE